MSQCGFNIWNVLKTLTQLNKKNKQHWKPGQKFEWIIIRRTIHVPISTVYEKMFNIKIQTIYSFTLSKMAIIRKISLGYDAKKLESLHFASENVKWHSNVCIWNTDIHGSISHKKQKIEAIQWINGSYKYNGM